MKKESNLQKNTIMVPNIYYWDDLQAVTMTVAFKMLAGNYGY